MEGDAPLRLSAVPPDSSVAISAADSASGGVGDNPLPSKHEREVAARQALLDKAAARAAASEASFRAESKKLRERELKMWKEQRETAKSRGKAPLSSPAHSPSSSSPAGAAATNSSATLRPSAPPSGRVLLHVRLPSGAVASYTGDAQDTLGGVLAALGIASEQEGRAVEVRCPVPLPGRVYRGEELATVTLAEAQLAPRGSVVLQLTRQDSSAAADAATAAAAAKAALAAGAADAADGIDAMDFEEEESGDDDDVGGGGGAAEEVDDMQEEPDAAHEGSDGDGDGDDSGEEGEEGFDGNNPGDLMGQDDEEDGGGHFPGMAPPHPPPPAAAAWQLGNRGGAGAVLGGGGGGAADLAALSAEELRQQRLQRLSGGGDRSSGGGVASGETVALGSSPPSLQRLLTSHIVERVRKGVCLAGTSYGGLDGATGGAMAQRLADEGCLTPKVLQAFRGCPMARLDLSKERCSNELLAEVTRKVSLTELNISHCTALTAEGCAGLALLRQLTSLDISGCRVTDSWLMIVARLPALVRLSMRACGKVTDAGLKRLGELENANAAVAKLKHLCLSGCGAVTDSGLQHLAKLPAMVSLDLSRLPAMTDSAVAALCAKLPALESLSVAGCPAVGSRTLQALGHACRRLKELDLQGTMSTVGLTTAARPPVWQRELRHLRGLDHLQTLRLPRLRPFGGEALRHLAALPALTSLDLEGLDRDVTSEALCRVGELVNLRILSLGGVNAATDAALAVLLPQLPLLDTLELAHTPVTGDVLEYIGALPGLASLSLRHCASVTSGGLPYLYRLRSLRSVNLVGTTVAEQFLEQGEGGSAGMAVAELRRQMPQLSIKL